MRPSKSAVMLVVTLVGTSGWSCTPTDQPQDDLTSPPPLQGGSIVPEPIPAGFDFPGDRDALQALANDFAISAMRTHAWHLWAGMTSVSGSSYSGRALPIWETWCGSAEVFDAKDCGEAARPSRGFEKPAQVGHQAISEGAANLPSPSDLQEVSFNKFNPAMASFTLSSHPGPGAGSFDYNSAASLEQLNDSWPAGTPTDQRKIVDTPYRASTPSEQGVAAIELKPVFNLVKGSGGLTPVPFWQGPEGATNTVNPTPATWKTCVLFDPAQPQYPPDFALRAATAAEIGEQIANPKLACETYRYAPLGAIYSFAMDADEAAAWNQVAAQSPPDAEQGLTAAAGDLAVLVAMHVNTKEIENWTWQTFWWQGGENPPPGEHTPGGIEDMTADVEDEWRNYATCANWLQTHGVGSMTMDNCFNPFLETALPAGIESNCMSCHGKAIVGGKPGYPDSYAQPVDFNQGPYYAEATSTDFSWAIAGAK